MKDRAGIIFLRYGSLEVIDNAFVLVDKDGTFAQRIMPAEIGSRLTSREASADRLRAISRQAAIRDRLIRSIGTMGHEVVSQKLRAAFLAARDSDAPLNERLALYTRAVEQYLPDYAMAVDQLVGRLIAAGADAGAPQTGDTLPSFLLPDEHGRLVSLEGVLQDGPAAIVFLRGHWCPYCRMTANALARVEEQVRPAGRRIIAITPERQIFANRLQADAGASFTFLSDSGNGYTLSLNLVIWLGDEIARMLASFGRDLPLYQGDPSWFVPIPATFVVSTAGIITARFIDPDYRRRMDSDALIGALTSAI